MESILGTSVTCKVGRNHTQRRNRLKTRGDEELKMIHDKKRQCILVLRILGREVVTVTLIAMLHEGHQAFKMNHTCVQD
jgi:hypothetical protein